MYRILDFVRLGELSVVRRALFNRRCNFKRWLSAANTDKGQVQVISDLINALTELIFYW